jgi:opacity protein-like surface antigen
VWRDGNGREKPVRDTLSRLKAWRSASRIADLNIGEVTMRRIALTVLSGAAVLAAWAGPAHSAPTFFYVRADAGGSFPTGSDLDGFDTSPVFGAGIGFSPLPFLRTDLTVTYRSDYSGSATDTTILPGITLTAKSKIKSLVGMANAYYDFPIPGPVTPYVGGGIGVARNELGTTTISAGGTQLAAVGGSTKTQFAWQVGGGLAFSVLPTIAIDIAYHYLDAGKFETASIGGSSASGRLKAHEVTAGLRVGF